MSSRDFMTSFTLSTEDCNSFFSSAFRLISMISSTPPFPKFHRHTQVDILLAILTIQVGTNRKYPFLIIHNGLYHLRDCGTRGIPCRSTHEAYKFTSSFPGSVNDLVDHLLTQKFGYGIPLTEVYLGNGTIVSPCPPSNMA